MIQNSTSARFVHVTSNSNYKRILKFVLHLELERKRDRERGETNFSRFGMCLND